MSPGYDTVHPRISATLNAVTEGGTPMDIPYWYSAGHKYPVANSLCAGMIPGFPLVMHNGVYKVEGTHVYGEWLTQSDARVKRGLQQVSAPSGGMAQVSVPQLRRYYPAVLASGVPDADAVSPEGLVGVLWNELGQLVREQRANLDEQRAELNALRSQVEKLLCERMPDQCLAPAIPELSP